MFGLSTFNKSSGRIQQSSEHVLTDTRDVKETRLADAGTKDIKKSCSRNPKDDLLNFWTSYWTDVASKSKTDSVDDSDFVMANNITGTSPVSFGHFGGFDGLGITSRVTSGVTSGPYNVNCSIYITMNIFVTLFFYNCRLKPALPNQFQRQTTTSMIATREM